MFTTTNPHFLSHNIIIQSISDKLWLCTLFNIVLKSFHALEDTFRYIDFCLFRCTEKTTERRIGSRDFAWIFAVVRVEKVCDFSITCTVCSHDEDIEVLMQIEVLVLFLNWVLRCTLKSWIFEVRSHLSNDIFFSLISMKLDVEILITLFNFFDDVDGTVLDCLLYTSDAADE